MKTLAQWRRTTKRAPVKRADRTVEPCYVQIGSLVLEMRERRGLTQQQIADAMGWTRANVANVEGGRCRVMMHDLPRLAKAIGLPTRDLLPLEWI